MQRLVSDSHESLFFHLSKKIDSLTNEDHPYSFKS